MNDYADIVPRLRSFAEAYPTDIFPPLTDAERGELKRGVMDRIGASMGRHCSKFMTEAADAIDAQGARLAEIERIMVALNGEDWLDKIRGAYDGVYG